MQAYSQAFAQVYNRRWTRFAEDLAPRLLAYYETTPIARSHPRILDLCCGTGQMARCFLDNGYHVTGIDLSPHMLRFARENAGAYLDSGQAEFFEADAASFTLDRSFGLVVSVFDSLNHLADFQALRGCFASVFAVLVPGGVFIFDLNTRLGLRRWNTIHIDDDEDLMLVNRGIYDGTGDKAYTHITGFIRRPDGLYERYEETVFNTAFEMEQVRGALLNAGWQTVRFATGDDLAASVEDPENHGRIFFVATK